jgi:hypothetical protein
MENKMKSTDNQSVSSGKQTAIVADQNPAELRALIEEMRRAINRASNDTALIGTVNSLFKTQNVDETIAQLKYLNSGGKPQWAF